MADWLSPYPDGPSHISAADRYTLRFKLPGITQANIMVAFLDGCLEIHGRARTEWEQEAPGIHYYETEELAAHHRVPLPADADVGRARVKLADEEAFIEIPRKNAAG